MNRFKRFLVHLALVPLSAAGANAATSQPNASMESPQAQGARPHQATPSSPSQATTVVVHPRPESGADVRYGYYWRLLEAALKATVADYGPFRTEQAPAVMNHPRAMQALADGQLQVYLRVALPREYADRIDMVPVPLDKGLTGFRVLLIHRDTQAALAKVRTLDDLRAFTLGQGTDWDDVRILSNARLTVVSGRNYEGLFGMLAGKRFDLFPRAVNEVLDEYQRVRTGLPELAIDDTLLLVYPLARYFLVSRSAEGQRLKARLVLGLERLRANGTLERMYAGYKREILHGLSLRGRRLIHIPNPDYQQPMYALGNKAYWDALEAERRK